MNFFSIIEYVGVFQGFIVAIALISVKKANIKANCFLSFSILSLSVAMLLHAFNSNHELYVNAISFLHGPLLFIYVRKLTDSEYKFSRKKLLHFTPFSLFIFLVPICKIFINCKYEELLLVTNIFLYIQFLIYWFLLAVVLIQYKNKVKRLLSSLYKISLQWLWVLLVLFAIIWGVSFFVEFFLHDYWDYVWIIVTLLLYITGYFALWQPEVFKEGIFGNDSGNKYKKSSLTDEIALSYLNRLNRIMSKNKPYLQGNITLLELSNILGVSTNHLSQIINQKYKQNFFDFINKYRVEEAKLLLVQPTYQFKKIIEIGFDSGFSSVSSFNKAFKKYTSMTPSVYRKKYSE